MMLEPLQRNCGNFSLSKELKFWNKNCYYLPAMQEELPFYGKLDGSILEWLSKLDVLFLTVRFERDMESARVVHWQLIVHSPSLQESLWREFKIGSNEIVLLKFVSSLILIFFSFYFSLPRKPIMNPFFMVLTFIFAYYLYFWLFFNQCSCTSEQKGIFLKCPFLYHFNLE